MLLENIIKRELKKKAKECSRFLAEVSQIAANIDKDLAKFPLESMDDLVFTVTIHSFWETEKSVAHKRRGSLETAMKEAIAIFKKKNTRSDVQGEYHVRVKMPNGSFVKLREKDFKQYEDQPRQE
jgi:hypothetical protein